MDLVSIIVPVYKAEKSLSYCIDSILRQTYTRFQAILVDDGSPDRCGEICDTYAGRDARIMVIHKENGGVSSARNAGICAAEGRYITFCDSDDFIEPDYLETFINTAKRYPDYKSIWCSYTSVSTYTQPTLRSPESVEALPVSLTSVKHFMSLQEKILTNQPWNKLYLAGVIKENGLAFPESLSLGEDMLFNLDYLDASGDDRVAIISKPMYNYFCGNESSLDNKFRSDLEDVYSRLNTELQEHLIKWNVDQSQFAKFHNNRFYQYERVFENMMKNPLLNKRERFSRINTILQSEEFKSVMEQRTCRIHPLLLKAYESGNYRNVLLVGKISETKRTVGGYLKGKRRNRP